MGEPQRRQPQVSRPVTCRVWRNGRRSSPATRPVCGGRCFCRWPRGGRRRQERDGAAHRRGEVEAKTPEDQAQLAYLEGLRKQKAGMSRARSPVSSRRRASIRVADGRAPNLPERCFCASRIGLSPEEAIAVLEGLRFAWRGDEIEYRVLRELGQLYLQTGDYPAGLRTLKAAAAEFPGRLGPRRPRRWFAPSRACFSRGGGSATAPHCARALR